MIHPISFIVLLSPFNHHINVDLGGAQNSKQSSNGEERKRGRGIKNCMNVVFKKVSHYLFSQLYTKHNQQFFFISVNNKVVGSEADFVESLS